MIKQIIIACLAGVPMANAQLSYPPMAGTEGSTALHKSDAAFKAWATGVEVVRGYVQVSDPAISHNGSNYASYGVANDALDLPDESVVSLGDGGTAVLTFALPVANGEGFDFAVFENGSDTFLELAFVEVSSDGINYFRFPSHSQTQTETPIGGFGSLDARNLNNLAGKYRADYGTPFDLSDLPDDDLLDKNSITHVKLVDVVGSLEDGFATYDSFGNKVNDPYPTPFYSSGFDLAGVGVINQGTVAGTNNPVPADITVYPNPADDVLFIGTKDTDNFKVTLYDASGRCVFATAVTGKIDVSGFAAGIYFVEIAKENSKTTKHIVIQ